jgi:hypothetical protein
MNVFREGGSGADANTSAQRENWTGFGFPDVGLTIARVARTALSALNERQQNGGVVCDFCLMQVRAVRMTLRRHEYDHPDCRRPRRRP